MQSKLEIIQRGSRRVDVNVLPETLDPDLAYRHGMVPGSWVEEFGLEEATKMARNAAIEFRDQLLNQARNDFAKGQEDSALLLFGMAMHPLMDIQAPKHHWQVYGKNPILGVDVISDIVHYMGERGSSPTKAEMKVMTNTLRYYFGRTVSRQFYQQAISASVGPRTR